MNSPPAKLSIPIPLQLRIGFLQSGLTWQLCFISDDRQKLDWALRQGSALGDMIIGTGGLGPTADDLTTEVVAEFLPGAD